MQTLWWLHIKILRHIIKKNSAFLSRFLRICNQSVQKVLIRAKIFYYKIQYWYQKPQSFTLISNLWKSFKKMHPKKVINKNVIEICTFFTFAQVRQTCFADNFFVHFFTLFSTDSKSAWNSAFFDIFFDFFPKKFVLGHIITFCKLWSQALKRLKKKKRIFLNVS